MVVSRGEKSSSEHSRWLCLCDCGVQKQVIHQTLVRGESRSCGCGRKSYDYTDPVHRTWRHMMERCFSKTSNDHRLYGARGITVCERWRSFENFQKDMAPRPPGTSLDRINNDGNYEPGNCRWADPKTQANNRGVCQYYEFSGEKLTIGQIAEKLDLPYQALYRRLMIYGWNIERATTEPLRNDRRRKHTGLPGVARSKT